MARRRTTSEPKQARKGTEPQEEIRGEQEMRGEQTSGRGPISTNPASWWEERWKIEQPRPEDQEPRYREQQERYEQERQRAAYYRPMEEIERPRPEDQELHYREEQERYERERQRAAYYRPTERIERPRPEERRVEGGEMRGVFQMWADSYAAASRVLEESYTNLYKPWIESTEEMYSKAVELSKNATPENYRAFYDEWIKTYQNTFGKLYSIPTQQFDKETFERLMDSAEELKNTFQSWTAMLGENSQKTQELFQGAPDPEKYRELYDTWMRTYGKIFQDLVEMPTKGGTREVLESYGGVPNIYFRSLAQTSKLWNESYMYLFRPWVDAMTRLSGKMAEISRGEARPEAYREFYNLWMDAYKETYDKLFKVQSTRPAAEEMGDSILRSMNVYLNMYNSWMAALEKMSQKTMEISTRTAEPEAYRGAYTNWISMYERAFDDFFRYTPMAGPMRNMMEPVKNATKTYTDMLTNMSDMWMKSIYGTTSRT